MQIFRKIPFYLLLFGLFFCLHGSVENFGSVPLKETVVTGLSVTIFVIVLFLITCLFSRNIISAALISIFISTWFFFFGAIYDFIKGSFFSPFLGRYSILLPALAVATVLFIFLVRKKKHSRERWTLYLNILFLIYCGIDAGRLVWLSATKPSLKAEQPFDYAAVNQKPDVYLLLLDSYPGNTSLKDSFGFDNTRLGNILQKDSMVSLPVSSNYDLTVYSMSSILNMDYIHKPWHLPVPAQRDLQMRMNEIKEASVFYYFKEMGYHIENNSIFDIREAPGISDENSFLLGHSILLTDKILLNRLNRDIGAGLPDQLVKTIPFLRDQSFYSHRDDNLRSEKKLLEGLQTAGGGQPVFNYTHLLIPHGPYYFDSTGKSMPFSKISSVRAWSDRADFISYLKYGTGIADECLSAIRKKRPGAIVILMSDHGFRYYNTDTVIEPAKFDNIYAVHFPNGNYGDMDHKLTGVNFFRYLFNSCFGQHFSYLGDTLHTIDY